MTPEQSQRLKEITEYVRNANYEVNKGRLPASFEERAFLHNLVYDLISERDEARKLCADYRDTYGGGPIDPLPWESNATDN